MELANSIPRATLDAFESVALPFLPNVARYARLLTRDASDADDLTQETFLRAYAAWNTFRPNTDCRRWLFTICRNYFLQDRKRSERFVTVEDPETELQATRQLYGRALAEGMNDIFDRIDVAPAITKGLEALVPEYREVTILIDIENCSYADAAATLGVPIGTVRSRLFRARRLLQEVLFEYAKDLGFSAVTRNDSPAGGAPQ